MARGFGRIFRCSGIGLGILLCMSAGGWDEETSEAAPLPSELRITITNPFRGAVNVSLGGTQSLVASVTGGSNTAVTWSVDGIGEGNAVIGTITSGPSGRAIYHAPVAMPPGNPVIVTATALADISKTASVLLTLTPAVGRRNPVVAVGTQKTTGIDFSLSRLDPTLGLADVGTCTGTLTPTLNVSCGTSVNGINAAQGARVIVWLLGQGLTSPDGSRLAPGLRVEVSQGATNDVAVSNLMPQTPQSGLTSIYFQMQVSPSAAPGLRNLVVTNGAGELQHFVGAIQITAGP